MDIVANDPAGKALTSWSSTGKIKTWTWAKLHARATAAAYEISEKIGLEPGSNIGLMIPNSEPFNFSAAFLGCLLADVIPLPIEFRVRNDAKVSLIGAKK